MEFHENEIQKKSQLEKTELLQHFRKLLNIIRQLLACFLSELLRTNMAVSSNMADGRFNYHFVSKSTGMNELIVKIHLQISENDLRVVRL